MEAGKRKEEVREGMEWWRRMEGEGGESGGDGGREWCPCCHPLTSCCCCPVIVLYCCQVVIVVPHVSELGWDELGMGDAHHSSFGCHAAAGNVAPASLVSIGHFCVCARPFVFALGWSWRSCLLLVVLWPWLLRGVRWHVSGARWWSSGGREQLVRTHKYDDDKRRLVVCRVWLPHCYQRRGNVLLSSFTSWGW